MDPHAEGPKQFRDRVAVITGGASGIGFATAERLAAECMKIVIADIESGALEAAVKKLESAGAAVLGVRTDVSKADEVEPGQVAQQIFEAIRDERFYIVPAQEEILAAVRQRLDEIGARRNPVMPTVLTQ